MLQPWIDPGKVDTAKAHAISTALCWSIHDLYCDGALIDVEAEEEATDSQIHRFRKNL
jgi:hypothetical protein